MNHSSSDPNKGRDANRDPITQAPGAHPIGTGVGAASGSVTGAVVGAAAGPVGMVVGAAVGAVAGGLAGKSVAEAVNPTAEDAYWREQYRNEPYYTATRTYDDYSPAYRTGYTGRGRYSGKSFDQIETELERDYNAGRGSSTLNWSEAKDATRAAWHRVERAIPGDADRDGR